MKKKTYFNIVMALILLLLILPQTVQAATYYLDAVNGNDANPGTSAQSWRTVDRAMPDASGTPRVTLGDTVILRNGNYGSVNFDYFYGVSVPQPQSWADKITYKAEAEATPVFSSLTVRPDPTYRHRYLEFDGLHVNVTTPYVTSAVTTLYVKSLRFRNMKATGYLMNPNEDIVDGHYTNVSKGGITEYVMHFSTQYGTNDILIENCDISNGNSAIQFTGAAVETPIIIRNNHIHDFGGHAVAMCVGQGEKITIEGNYIHRSRILLDYQVFRCSNTVSGDPTLWGQWHDNRENLIQDVTGAKGRFGKFLTDQSHVMVYPTTDTPWEIGYTIRGENIPLICEPVELTQTDCAHAGGIMLRVDNLDIKNNIIHAVGYTSIHTFPGDVPGGYSNLLIENNLVYDSPGVYPILLETLGTNVTIRNNTFVGNRGGDYPTGSHNAYYYRTPVRLTLDSSRDGSGIAFYNNIIVGWLLFNSAMTNHQEDNNLIYYVAPGFVKGSNTIVYSNGANEPKVFDTDFFVDPDYSRGTNFVRYPGDGGPHGRICDYRLLEGAPAIGFADPLNAPATDILGNPRDVLPDAGCYEYGSVLFLYGDVSEDSEISAYDAALTAQAAVDLITLTPEQFSAADVDGSTDISAYDAALIAQYSVGLISKFPVEG